MPSVAPGPDIAQELGLGHPSSPGSGLEAQGPKQRVMLLVIPQVHQSHGPMKKLLIAAALVLLSVGVLWAQMDRQLAEWMQLCTDLANNRKPPGQEEFTFARFQFTSNGPGRRPFRNRTPCGIWEGWSHDYPVAEDHFLRLTKELTRISTTLDSYAIVRLDSDDIFKYRSEERRVGKECR